MSGAGQGALEQALACMATPALLPGLRTEALPADVLLLLKLAAGDEDSLVAESGRHGLSATKLHEVAVFYIQQVLFAQGADSYRVLGARPDIAATRLREHYRWLVRWLHPDRNRNDWEDVYLERVHRAWQQLRTPERRHVHDMAQLSPRPTQTPRTAASTVYGATASSTTASGATAAGQAPAARARTSTSPARRARTRASGKYGVPVLFLLLCGFAALLALLWHRDPGPQEETGVAVDLAATQQHAARPDGSRMALLPDPSGGDTAANASTEEASLPDDSLPPIRADAGLGSPAVPVSSQMQATAQTQAVETALVAKAGLVRAPTAREPAFIAKQVPVVSTQPVAPQSARTAGPPHVPAVAPVAADTTRIAKSSAVKPPPGESRGPAAPSTVPAVHAPASLAIQGQKSVIEGPKAAPVASAEPAGQSARTVATAERPGAVAAAPSTTRPIAAAMVQPDNGPARPSAGTAAMNDRVAFALVQKFRRAYNEGDATVVADMFVAGGNRQQVIDALRRQLQSSERAKLSFGRLDWRIEGERVLVEAGYRVQRSGVSATVNGQVRFELREDAGAFRILRLQPEAF